MSAAADTIAAAPPRQSRWRRIKLAGLGLAAAGLILVGVFAAWVVSLGPLPMGEARQVSTTVVDRNGKLLRAYAMADGRWRLPVDARANVDPTYLKLLFAYEDKRFYSHDGVDPLCVGPRRAATRDPRPHRIRRIDHHHAACAADGAAAGSDRSMPSCARWSARSRSSGV